MTQKMNLETVKPRFSMSHYVAGFLLIALATVALYLRGQNGGIVEELEARETTTAARSEYKEDVVSAAAAANESGAGRRCDLYSGRWIYEEVSRPLYEEGRCSFMLGEYACQKYGRKNIDYQKWRWQPHHCDLPRFNGTALLEKIRGKRLIFVGDSLIKNQWTSLLCLIESSHNGRLEKLVMRNDNLFTFKAIEYNATVEFYWSPLLVESNCDDPDTHAIRDRIIRIESIEKHARHWTDAEILIFDSFMWWLEPTMTILWGSFGSSDAIYKRVEMKLRRYEMALTTWSNWLEVNLNPTKTNLFFMSLSPYHFFGESWDDKANCYNATWPILKENYRGIGTDGDMMMVAESVLHNLEMRGVNVTYLNITRLSDYRRDAHPSIHRKFNYHLTEEQLSNPKSYYDCVHWCLPGVPDVWNEILYSHIIDL